MTGNAYGVLALMIWSTSALLVSFTPSIPPLLTVSISFFIAFLMSAAGWWQSKESLRTVFKQPIWAYIISIGGIGGNTALYTLALKTSPIIQANLINYLWPLCIVVFSVLILKSRLSLFILVGVICGFFGTAIVLGAKSDFHFGITGLLLFLPAFLSALSWGLYSVLTQLVPSPPSFMGVVYLISSLLLFLLSMIFETLPGFSWADILPLFLLGFNARAFSFWDRAMKTGDPIMLASLAYLVPFFSTLWLILFGRGDWTTATLVGGALIVLGGIIANIQKIRQMRQQSSL